MGKNDKSRGLIQSVLSEKRSKGCLSSPAKKRPRESKKTNIDSFDREALRRIVLSLYKEGFIPSLNDIVAACKDKLPTLNLSRWSVWKIMHNIGFTYKTNNFNRKFLMERAEIVAKRNDFLFKMKDARETGMPIIYLDETWVNVNLTLDKIWIIDDNDEAFRKPIGKGSRIIVVHAGSTDGFVKNAL